jgi:hypothetical protein
MVVPVMVVVPSGCEGRAGDYQQQEGGENELLHAKQISTILFRENAPKAACIKSATTYGKTLFTQSNQDENGLSWIPVFCE